MSDSSFDDTEKDTRRQKDTEATQLSQHQQDLLEAAEPPFTVHDVDDIEGHGAGLRQVGTGTSLRQVPSSKPSVNNIRSVPNGGTKAWLQVLASFFLFFNSWGIVNTFGKSSPLSTCSDTLRRSDLQWDASLENICWMTC